MGERQAGLVRVAMRRIGPPPAAAPSGGSGSYEQLYRSDLYVCAGLLVGAGYNDNPAVAECGGTGNATGSFDPFLIAIPEVAWETGTLTSIGFYAEGGPGFRCWAGVFADTLDGSGNHYPGAVSGVFEHGPVGFDGDRFRSGVIAVAVTKGDIFWTVTQTTGSNFQRGYRLSEAYRPLLGENTTLFLSATTSVGYMGFRTAAAAAYNAALAAFPAGGVLLNIGTAPISGGAGNTLLRPSTYVQLTPS